MANGYRAEILADSVTKRKDGVDVRLTTVLARFPRFILAELNTHRSLCLAGDAELEFDLPAGMASSKHRVHRMRLDEFVDKWINGARRVEANPKRDYDLSWINPEEYYASSEVAMKLGMHGCTNINALCRTGDIPARRADNGKTWMILGEDVIAWRQSKPEHTRFDMRAKLAQMKIRQLNEDTGNIQWSSVVNATVSGRKLVYTVCAGNYEVSGSIDHRILTIEGWKTIGELSTKDCIIVRKFGKHNSAKADPNRLRKFDGIWRSVWQSKQRAMFIAEDPMCRKCKSRNGVDVHHIEPVHVNPSRALDPSNITFLCEPCHEEMHAKQNWQGGTYLYGAAARVDCIKLRGEEETYDLEIAGGYPNFVANGVVVHNSKSSASSRAIPVEKRIAAVREDPFIPESFGRNKKGMQAGEALEDEDQYQARRVWLEAAMDACNKADVLRVYGVHKQHANRLLEPFAWHEAIITGTEWSNFFHLRISEHAQPEFRRLAEAIRDAMADSEPNRLRPGMWHLPLVGGVEDAQESIDTLVKLSVARCARVSYLTHEGKRDPVKDIELHDRLLENGHMSPFEHAAVVGEYEPTDGVTTLWKSGMANAAGKPLSSVFNEEFIGNFCAPWIQYRKLIPNESDILGGR